MRKYAYIHILPDAIMNLLDILWNFNLIKKYSCFSFLKRAEQSHKAESLPAGTSLSTQNWVKISIYLVGFYFHGFEYVSIRVKLLGIRKSTIKSSDFGTFTHHAE